MCYQIEIAKWNEMENIVSKYIYEFTITYAYWAQITIIIQRKKC